ncbi:MAG TPA: metallophosphoesterase [Fimbriiglobus sp.]|nr:metallophosphoesterase [Fimbriiglobus sp.]
MKRILLLVAVAVPVLAAAVYSRQQPAVTATTGLASELKIATAEKNPWTGLKLNNDKDQFQFVVVSDRTGGHRAKIFSRAVHQINLLQPEFVLSVGDLIEGYTQKPDVMDAQWKEFEGYLKNFQMPFFYVPGNHDLTNKEQVEYWGGRYGRSYYHFVYRDVLFLAVNSEDGAASTVSAEQTAYFKKALEENPNVRWTLVFLHKPLWAMPDLEKNGWADMEGVLAGRKYTVFCGHVHRYQKFVRNGMNYYQLATTGGGSRLRGVEYGEFDQVAWITMRPDGPLIANIMLEGVYPENLQIPDTDEKAVERRNKPEQTQAFRGRVTLDGMPAAGATVRFYRVEADAPNRPRYVADGLTQEDGTFQLSTHKAFDGIPAGEYRVTVVQTGKYATNQTRDANKLPEKYSEARTTPLRVTVKTGDNVVNLDLTK